MKIYGKQLFLHLLNNYPKRLLTVYLGKECDKKLFSQIARLDIPIERVDEKKAQAMAKGGNHQGFLADIEPELTVSLASLKKSSFVVVLCGITDMGNIGAIIRSAYAFGVDGIIISNIKELKMETILRTSSAAALEIPICLAPNVLDVLSELGQSGFTIYGADMDGENARNIKFDGKKVLILGSEGEGLSKKVLDKCNKKISIKMKREFDSLNVSAAAAILCERMSNE